MVNKVSVNLSEKWIGNALLTPGLWDGPPRALICVEYCHLHDSGMWTGGPV